MSVLLTTLLSALLPVGVEGIKQIITTKMGGVKPTTIAEQLQIDDSEIKKLQAVAALDNPGGTPSQWVVDLRASSRYIAAGIVIIGGVFGNRCCFRKINKGNWWIVLTTGTKQ